MYTKAGTALFPGGLVRVVALPVLLVAVLLMLDEVGLHCCVFATWFAIFLLGTRLLVGALLFLLC